MKHIRACLAALALIAAPVAALAQSFPQTMPPQTVYGRLGTVPGPGQAIPLTTLGSLIGGGGGIPAGPADSALGNFSGATAAPIYTLVPSCSTASSALTYSTATHTFGCNSITGGGGLPSIVTGSSLWSPVLGGMDSAPRTSFLFDRD